MKRPRLRQPARTPEDQPLVFSLVNAGRAVEQRLEAALSAAGLSLAKFGALTHLMEAGGALSLGECAQRMTCVRSNITQLVGRLEADGLVRRVEDAGDRRTVRAEVTALGARRQAAGARAVAKVQAEIARALRTKDPEALQRALVSLQ